MGVSGGTDERVTRLIETGVDMLVVDTAHGHSRNVRNTVKAISRRCQELHDLLALERKPFWHYRRYGVEALLALGKKAEAVKYAEASRGLNQPDSAIDQTCEEILIPPPPPPPPIPCNCGPSGRRGASIPPLTLMRYFDSLHNRPLATDLDASNHGRANADQNPTHG